MDEGRRGAHPGADELGVMGGMIGLLMVMLDRMPFFLNDHRNGRKEKEEGEEERGLLEGSLSDHHQIRSNKRMDLDDV